MQQPHGEVQWRTMTDNPLADKEMDKSMGERLARSAGASGSPSAGRPS